MSEVMEHWSDREYPEAVKIIKQFNSEIYPAIKQQYSPDIELKVEETKNQLESNFNPLWQKLGSAITISQLKTIFNSFGPKRKQEELTNRSEFEFTMQTIKGFVEYVLGQEHLDQQSKNQLLLEAMWVDLQITDYCFGTIYYNKVATHELSKEHRDIVKNCLEICDQKNGNPSIELVYKVRSKK